MIRMITILLVLSTFSLPSTAYSAKCKSYKTKLETIQSKQRQGNSVKRSNKLKEQEQKAFKKWRKCQQGKLK
ncbi:hypothetical protein ACFSJY_15800 [Thalassotalea euphylliae]|uniref:hypothetical protein n=1 Tax=Thalassotalea euphylliae TaxID=1655234 RepID=UPI00362C8351